MVSTYGDPLFFGYFVLCFIYILDFYAKIFKIRYLFLLKIFSIVTLLFSYVRGPAVIYLCVFVYGLFEKSRFLMMLSVFLSVSFVFVFVFVVVFVFNVCVSVVVFVFIVCVSVVVFVFIVGVSVVVFVFIVSVTHIDQEFFTEQ